MTAYTTATFVYLPPLTPAQIKAITAFMKARAEK